MPLSGFSVLKEDYSPSEALRGTNLLREAFSERRGTFCSRLDVDCNFGEGTNRKRSDIPEDSSRKTDAVFATVTNLRFKE